MITVKFTDVDSLRGALEGYTAAIQTTDGHVSHDAFTIQDTDDDGIIGVPRAGWEGYPEVEPDAINIAYDTITSITIL